MCVCDGCCSEDPLCFRISRETFWLGVSSEEAQGGVNGNLIPKVLSEQGLRVREQWEAPEEFCGEGREGFGWGLPLSSPSSPLHLLAKVAQDPPG